MLKIYHHFIFQVPAAINFMLGLIIFIAERCREARPNPENTQFVAIMTFCSAIDIQSLRLISSKIFGLESFSVDFSPISTKIIAWISVVNIFIEDIPQFIIQVEYKKAVQGFTFIPFASLILSSIVLVCSLERLFYAIDTGPCTPCDCFNVKRLCSNLLDQK
ncbi:9862_t:CDS:2 [Scutellospora calospora]|uniref:9862_t:CDS:1 n=1 Tax=Scutellospora calospora TaxID=85575 RepID=A0ACA9JU82_9GLOM|nr:9862_t:CDS:2 [Scutellospora calospora]